MTTTNREGVKVYSYIRVSTSIQVDGYSLDAQRQAIQNYANYEKMHIVREYADEGFSGKNIAGREQFQEMLEDIQSDRDGVKFVLVFKLSRFGRNAADTLFSLQTMQDFGVNLISVDDKLDSSTDVGKVMISIMSSMAEMERDNIHAQTMAGRRQKARMGGWNGGFAPYGYKLINGHLTVEEEEAKVVRMIFDLFVNTTLGANGVAKKLNDDGIKKIVRQNGKLDAFTGHFVKLVLDNPVYMGKIAFGRRHTAKVNGKRNEYKVMKQLDESCIIIADGEHDALVSEELWRKAEAKRKETGIKKEKKEQDHEYILSGLIKCPCCGKGMYGIVSRSKKRKDGTPYPPYYSYSCRETMTKTGRQCEFGKSFSAPKLDEEVRKLIVSLVNTPDFAEAVKGLINKEIDVSELTERLANLQKQLRQLYSRQRHLEQQQDNLDFDAPNFDKMSESITRRLNDTFDEMTRVEGLIRETQTRIQNVEQQKLTQDSIYQFLLMFDKLYDKMTDMEKKTFMQSFIESIEIYRERQKDGHYVKAINFNFPVSYNGELVTTISPLKETTVESVVLLSREKADDCRKETKMISDERSGYKSWSNLKKQMHDLLCDSLKDKISYFYTSYHEVHNAYGRATINYNKKEIVAFSWVEMYAQEREVSQLYQEGKKVSYGELEKGKWMPECKLCDADFINSLTIYLKTDIATSLNSDNYLLRVFAYMDRRVGKRTLIKIKDDVEKLPDWVKQFYRIRCEADSIIFPPKRITDESVVLLSKRY